MLTINKCILSFLEGAFVSGVRISTKTAQIRTAGVFHQRNVRVGAWEIKFRCCCKIKSYLQQPLSFLGGQSVECRTLHFSAQAKPAHAESVIFVYGKQTCSGFVVLGRLFQAVFGSNSAFPNRPSASRLHSFRILNAVARIKRRVSLLVFPRVRNLPNP